MTAGTDAAAPRPRRRRSRLVLGLVVVGVLLLGAEVVVRTLGLVDVRAGVKTRAQAEFYEASMFVTVDDPARAYVNRPDARVVVDDILYAHDGRGWRVGDSPTPGAGRVPVAFLGDSTTYGWGVPLGDTLPVLTARALDDHVLPLNLGVNGYSTQQELALYRASTPALADVPVIVVLLYPNDPTRHTFLWDDVHHALYVDPLPVPHALKGLFWRSGLYRGLVSWRAGSLAARGLMEPTHPDNIATCIAALEELARQVRRDGRTLLVAHLPAMLELDPYPFDALVAAAREACRRESVPFVDLLEPLLAEREVQIAAYEQATGTAATAQERRAFLSRYWIDQEGPDQHPDGEANRLCAEALARALAPLLP